MGVRKEGAQMVMPMPAEWSFGTTIPAKDLDGTRRFYEGVLGAQVVMEDPGGIIYRSGDSYFSLYPTEFAGTAQHTLGAFMVQDVEAAVADLRGKGVTFEEYDLPGVKMVNGIAELGGSRGAWFKDPEGNILSVVQLPAAGSRGRAAPATECRSRRHPSAGRDAGDRSDQSLPAVHPVLPAVGMATDLIERTRF
jgi:catechol 2,3-dioxygenase-like lactoylglutathione lyase family enzyme